MSITQILRGDATGAVKAIQDLNKAIDATEANYKESAKEAKKLEAQAKRITEAANPQQKYNRQMEELAVLVKRGKVELSDAEKKAEAYGRQLKNAGKSGSDSLSSILSVATSLAGGILSVTGLVNGLKQAFVAAEESAQAAADTVFASLGAQGELQQLTDDPTQLARINQYGRDLVKRGVFAPEQQAQAFKTSFVLESAGYSAAEKESLARVGESGLVAPENIVTLGGSIRKVQRLFGEGSFTEVLDKLVATASKAQASLTEVSGAIPEFATEAKAVGLDIDQSLAGFGAVEAGSPTVDIAKTRYARFLDRLDKSKLAVEGDLGATLTSLEQMVASGKTAFDLFPESRGRKAFRNLLGGRDLIATLQKEIANSGGLAERRGGMLGDVSPLYAAGKLSERTKGDLAITKQDKSAEIELLFDAYRNLERKRMSESGAWNINKAYREFVMGLTDVTGTEFGEMLIQRRMGSITDPELLKRLESYSRRTALATEKIHDKQRTPVASGRQE